MDEAFPGFPAGLFDFLAELMQRNEKAWFEANRARYERDVRGPALAFIRAMRPRLARVSAHLLADDRKVGGSLMRVHRDTRFSADKTPYKTNVGIQFRHVAGKDVHAPGLYVHLSPEECFVGAGMWMPDAPALAAIRTHIDRNPGRWAAVLGDPALNAAFRQAGERLKRVPRGYPADHPQAEELKRTSFLCMADLDADTLRSPRVADHLAERLAAAAPYMAFLCEAVALPF
jgi:uncharacterized protein (TIGR02453 family)